MMVFRMGACECDLSDRMMALGTIRQLLVLIVAEFDVAAVVVGLIITLFLNGHLHDMGSWYGRGTICVVQDIDPLKVGRLACQRTSQSTRPIP